MNTKSSNESKVVFETRACSQDIGSTGFSEGEVVRKYSRVRPKSAKLSKSYKSMHPTSKSDEGEVVGSYTEVHNALQLKSTYIVLYGQLQRKTRAGWGMRKGMVAASVMKEKSKVQQRRQKQTSCP